MRTYVLVFVALLVLTAVTILVSYVDLGALGPPVALGIALVKASLVVFFFMHLRDAPGVLWLAAASGFFWLAILIVLTMSDLATRGMVPVPGK